MRTLSFILLALVLVSCDKKKNMMTFKEVFTQIEIKNNEIDFGEQIRGIGKILPGNLWRGINQKESLIESIDKFNDRLKEAHTDPRTGWEDDIYSGLVECEEGVYLCRIAFFSHGDFKEGKTNWVEFDVYPVTMQEMFPVACIKKEIEDLLREIDYCRIEERLNPTYFPCDTVSNFQECGIDYRLKNETWGGFSMKIRKIPLK